MFIYIDGELRLSYRFVEVCLSFVAKFFKIGFQCIDEPFDITIDARVY